ncbi:MAG: hypothetical protein U5R31_15780 [Acidimicrobiia bacterium]|nr:hypothetical protein [Acidimicrobiia bacterium]
MSARGVRVVSAIQVRPSGRTPSSRYEGLGGGGGLGRGGSPRPAGGPPPRGRGGRGCPAGPARPVAHAAEEIGEHGAVVLGGVDQADDGLGGG